jgi:hypothetical protein
MRTRTPTAVLELRGAFKKNPQRGRERDGEPKPQNPIGPPPSSLKEAEKTAWKEMAAEGFWLTSADRFMLEIAAGLIVQHRRGIIDNPARSLLISTLSKLGFGPTERSKLKVQDAPKQKNGFAKFKKD